MRYLPLTADDRAEMLKTIGAKSVDDFYGDVPASARLKGPVAGLPNHQGEMEVERHMAKLARKNRAASDGRFFVGCGAYKHHIPASVDHIIQRSEFLTTYTPYQPEIAQGTLQTMFEFQTQVAALTGMEVANASMYDGSTACAEAAVMACRVTKRNTVIMSGGLHPHYADTTRTLCEAAGIKVVQLPPAVDGELELAKAVERRGGLRDRAVAQRVRHGDGPVAGRRCGARQGRAAGERVHGSRVARAGEAAGRDGRRHRRWRRPVDRRSARFWRALCRPLHLQARSSCARCRDGCAARRWMRMAGAASC